MNLGKDKASVGPWCSRDFLVIFCVSSEKYSGVSSFRYDPRRVKGRQEIVEPKYLCSGRQAPGRCVSPTDWAECRVVRSDPSSGLAFMSGFGYFRIAELSPGRMS